MTFRKMVAACISLDQSVRAVNITCDSLQSDPSLHDFEVEDLSGSPVRLDSYRDSVVLLVNVASF